MSRRVAAAERRPGAVGGHTATATAFLNAGDVDGRAYFPVSPPMVRTTFPVFCSVSTYLVAATTCSSG